MCSANRTLVWLLLACLLGQSAALAQEGVRPVLPASVDLRHRSSAGPERAIPAAARQSRERGRDSGQQRPRTRIYLAAALAASAGTLAWWSARQADQAYARYRHAAGQKRQQEQFRRAGRYDRLAGAGFAAMEAGMVLTAYWTFF